MCECHQVGGPFIAEDPECPIHGAASVGRETEIEEIIDVAIAGEITSAVATQKIIELFY